MVEVPASMAMVNVVLWNDEQVRMNQQYSLFGSQQHAEFALGFGNTNSTIEYEGGE
jgi:hypothetical protein